MTLRIVLVNAVFGIAGLIAISVGLKKSVYRNWGSPAVVKGMLGGAAIVLVTIVPVLSLLLFDSSQIFKTMRFDFILIGIALILIAPVVLIPDNANSKVASVVLAIAGFGIILNTLL